MEPYIPPKRKAVLGLAALCAGLVAAFLLLLVHGLRAPRPINAADYPEPVPAGLVWDLTACERADGMLTVEGWACVYEQRFEAVDIRAALLGADGAGWVLPTVLREDAAAKQAIGDVVFGEYGGFTSRCAEKSLPAGKYEVCIAYRCNGHDTLVPTGAFVEVAP